MPAAIDDPRWLEFVESHPDATPFHLPAWAALIAECYRFEAFVLAMRDTDGGEILAGAPDGGRSLPARPTSMGLASLLGLVSRARAPRCRSGRRRARHSGSTFSPATRGNSRCGRVSRRRTTCTPCLSATFTDWRYPEDPADLHPAKASVTAAIVRSAAASRSPAALRLRMSRRSTDFRPSRGVATACPCSRGASSI